MKKLIAVTSAALVLVLGMTSCETPGDSALAGAGLGAAIGGLMHGRGSDAVGGAVIGAGAGYLLGKAAQDQRRVGYERGYMAWSSGQGRSRYPWGRPTGQSGFVRSPYQPYRIVDVRGLPHRSEVIDPYTDRIFVNP